MIELLEQCVRIPSLSGQEGEVAIFLRDQMAARGFDRAFIDAAGNAVGVMGAGPRQLVMLGHMDTVGGHVPVRYEQEALYGRGTVDAKGPLCAFILAAERLIHSELAAPDLQPSDVQVIVVGATEEETASSKGARYAATQYKPEWCIIGEPSGSDSVTLGYKGRLLVEARYEQSTRHTAMPGPSAGEQAVLLWNHVQTFSQEYNHDKPRSFDQISPSLRSICSGEDGLREWCDLLIGFRLPIECGPHEMQQRIEEWTVKNGDPAAVPESLPASPGVARNSVPVAMGFRGHEQAYRSPKDSSLVREFVDAIRAERMRPAFKLKTGTADFNVVGPIWQCPLVAYGPGDSTLDHTPDEHVAVAEFEQSVHVLERVLRKFVSR